MASRSSRSELRSSQRQRKEELVGDKKKKLLETLPLRPPDKFEKPSIASRKGWLDRGSCGDAFSNRAWGYVKSYAYGPSLPP